MTTVDFTEPRMACFPGGPARQYRVQVRNAGTAVWRHIASYTRRDRAADCLALLNRKGYQARVVSYRFCPTAG